MPQVSFQQGVDGYTSTLDTMLRENSPHQSYASATSLSVDGNDGGGSDNQILLRFDDLFGSGGDHPQIPVGATITEATLTLQTNNTGGGAELHRMLSSWKENDTYASLDDGIQA